MRSIHHHFSNIARRYRDLRTTDIEPILCIRKALKNFGRIVAADIGCGAGRYDLKLFASLGTRLHLTCLDCNRKMLEELEKYLSRHGILNYQTVRSRAESLPLGDNSLDCLFSFNAVHHFDFARFLEEASRVLKEESCLFVYTRLRSQNRSNIWGRYFPLFAQKETRLQELEELRGWVATVPKLELKSVEFFKYRRVASLESLISLAHNGHYSTFYLYSREELKEALAGFKQNVLKDFSDLNNISWLDENVMLVLVNQASRKPFSFPRFIRRQGPQLTVATPTSHPPRKLGLPVSDFPLREISSEKT